MCTTTLFNIMAIFSTVMILSAWSVAAEREININKNPVIKKRGECVQFQEEHRFPLLPESKIEWKKYETSIVRDTDRISVASDQRTMAIRQVTPEDSAIYSSNVTTKGGLELTNYWLEVQGCDIHEKEIEFSGCDMACKAMCEEGWYHFNDKCYKYFSTPKTWLDAYYYCQGGHGSKLATIDNHEENRFVGTLLKSGDGGWIGLNDRSKESNFLWNYNKFGQPSFFAWDKKDPKNPEPNNFNGHCNVEMCAELKHSTKKWNDVVCKAQIEYVCEKNSDKDIPDWRCWNGKCYFYVREKVVWEWARRGCSSLNSTMLTIKSSTENKYVGTWIKGNVWLGLNDRVEAGLYVWDDIGQSELSNRPTFLNWDVGEPNDKHYNRKSPEKCNGEDCVQIKSRTGVTSWYDLNCNTELPFICEKSRDPYLSFAAWIALSMGAGLILSIFGGRIYMEYRQRRGGKEVKQMMAATLDREDEGKD